MRNDAASFIHQPPLHSVSSVPQPNYNIYTLINPDQNAMEGQSEKAFENVPLTEIHHEIANAEKIPIIEEKGQKKRTLADFVKEIDGAVNQMKTNIQSVGQRGERLDALQDKTDNLATQANGFRRGANRVRKQMWWKDMKMRMCIIVGIIVLLVVIIVPSGKCHFVI